MVRGADDVHGAQSVITDNGVIQLKFLTETERQEFRLLFGMTVERYLSNDDYVIFNRQPSLHRIGFLGHKVRLFPNDTFRINLSVTSPYNADFDGDEMNLHALQSQEASSECRMLMAVGQQIITPQSCKPVMGIVQDALLGSFLLTHKSTILTRQQMMRAAASLANPPKDATVLAKPAIQVIRAGHAESYWTGAQAFSMLLPSDFTLDRGRRGDRWPDGVLILNGHLLYGQLTKSLLGSSTGGIIDNLYRMSGVKTTVEYMSNVQQLVNPWLMNKGFSVSLRDAVISHEGQRKIAEHVAIARSNIETIVGASLPASLMDLAEGTISSMVNKIMLQTGTIARKYMPSDSSIATMVDAGSKGTPLNICQVFAIVGQQSVNGRRIFSDSLSRTLNCFEAEDRTLLSHGFVESSYCTGLTPCEFFFHNMGGREGLVDTAVKTASTGYIQRRLVKSMEDLTATYLADVRTADGIVVQFCLGLDGWDPIKIQHYQLNAITMSGNALRAEICDARPSEVQERELAKAHHAAKEARRSRFSALRTSLDSRTLLPFHPDHLLDLHRGDAWMPRGAARKEYEEGVERAADALCEVLGRQRASRRDVILTVRYSFCSRRLLEHGIRHFQPIFDYVQERCEEALITPGESVGTIAAQSLGEPTTQMQASPRFSSFHAP